MIAKVFNEQGCIAYRCRTAAEGRRLLKTLEKSQQKGVQIVVLDSPDIYAEYAPYNYIEEIQEFTDKVSQLNRMGI